MLLSWRIAIRAYREKQIVLRFVLRIIRQRHQEWDDI
jgi:hypothetical protein